jgi:hypothetical protein
MASDAYAMDGMTGLYAVELEPEVRPWLERLSDRDFGRADFLVGLPAEQAETLGEPYTRHLGGKVRELRFHVLGRQPRITYWLASGRRIVLLTVFRKTGNGEVAVPYKPRRPAKPGTGPRTTPSTGRQPDMASSHTSYEEAASQRRASDEYPGPRRGPACLT